MAVTVLCLVLLALACSSDKPEPSLLRSPIPMVEEEVLPTETPEPTPPPLTPIQPAALRPVQEVTENGTYILDTATGGLWFAQEFGVQGGLWSSDSNAIFFTRCCVHDGFIDILHIPSGRSVRVHSGDIIHAAWAPEGGGQIAYATYDEPGLYVVNRDGTGNRLLVRAKASRLRWLDSGRLAYSQLVVPGSPDLETYLIDLTTGQTARLQETNPPSDLDPRIIFGTASPDGSHVAFVQGDSAYVWTRATDTLTRITDQRMVVIWLPLLAWHPNEPKLLVSENLSDGPWPVIRLVDLQTGASTPLDRPALWRSWLPDGLLASIDFGCGRDYRVVGEMDVFVHDLESGQVANLTNTPDVLEYGLGASRARPQFAFVELRRGSSQLEARLYLIDLSDGSRRVIGVASDHVGVTDESWSPDGRYLSFWVGGGRGICN